VGDVFAVDLGELKPNDDKVTKFADYLTENYIDKNSTFPSSIWVEMTASSQRSTNACESFHRKCNSYFVLTHSNVYTFLKILKFIQIDTGILIYSSTIEIKKVKKATEDKRNFINNLHVINEINNV
jgi:hypothetical protein